MFIVLLSALCHDGRGIDSYTHTQIFWGLVSPKKMHAAHFTGKQDHHRELISANELLTVFSVLDTTAKRTVSLLTTDVKSRKLVIADRPWS